VLICRPPHRDGQKDKRSNRAANPSPRTNFNVESCGVSPAALSASSRNNNPNEDVSRQAQGLHSIGFGQLQKFLHCDQRHRRRKYSQHRHRCAQHQQQHNRNQDDRGRDALQQEMSFVIPNRAESLVRNLLVSLNVMDGGF
jgi:hypothetical protein